MVTFTRRLIAAGILLSATAGPAVGQTGGSRIVPTHSFLVTGYGTVGYGVVTQGENENAFTSSLNPIFLFQFQDRVLFEAEFEFELEGGVTATGLEYAQVDVILSDNISFVGGKFLLPFGVFGDRLHPTWINKFPTAPPIYGHHVAAFGSDPLMSIASDLGFMVRGVIDPGRFNLGLNLYAVQGAAAEDTGGPIPAFEFQGSSEDSNTDKMFGARIDIALPPWFEVNLSAFNGDYDDQNVLDLTGWNVAGEFHYGGFEARGEYAQIRQEVETVSGFPTFVRDGFYAQASYRIGRFEPLFRWTQVFESDLEGAVQDEGASQVGFGLDYWFSPSISIMSGFELNNEFGPELDNDRFIFHIAYGF